MEGVSQPRKRGAARQLQAWAKGSAEKAAGQFTWEGVAGSLGPAARCRGLGSPLGGRSGRAGPALWRPREGAAMHHPAGRRTGPRDSLFLGAARPCGQCLSRTPRSAPTGAPRL